MVRSNTQKHIFLFLCIVFSAITFFGTASPVRAVFSAPGTTDCWGPGQTYDNAFSPTPQINQFFCSTRMPSDTQKSTSNPYQCYQTTAGVNRCDSYLAPLTDYYTCAFFGMIPTKGSTAYQGVLFDSCVHSLVPPTVILTPGSTSIVQGNSTTLTWTVQNATSCTSSWAGAIPPTNGSQTITPAVTTTYSLTCTGAGTTGPISTTVTVTPPPDTTPPTDPSGLSASAASTSQINLSWIGSTDSGGSGLAGYKIERCMGTGCTSFVQIGLSATNSYSDTGLAPATTYTYQVRAYDNAGNNSVGYSNPAPATTWTPPDTIPPSAPFLSGVPFSATQIDLSWTASIDNSGGSGLLDYRLYRGGTLIATLGTTITTYSDPGLTSSTIYSYYVVARDVAGNPANSNTISVTTPAPPDITPPIFIFTSPAATLSSGTTSALLAGTTNENATCRYATTAGVVFASMTLFTTTGGVNHSQNIIGLADGTTYTYYVKCRDTSGNTNAVDVSYMFQVSSPAPDLTPPVISGGAPTGVLPAGTATAIMSVTTNENAYCRYNQGSDIAFSAMTGILSGSVTAHSASLTGLTNGTSYLYFVRCQDTPAGNVNANGYAISFSVANPVNMNPVAVIAMVSGSSGTAPFVASADGSGSYDTDGTIAQYIWKWGDGSPDTIGVSTASHTYTIAGTYTITLQVIDNQGGSGTVTQQIVVSAGAPPPPPPPPPVSFCVAACTTDADCGWPTVNSVCGLSGVCVAGGSMGGGPVRTNGYLTLPNGTMSQPTPGVFPSNTTSVVMSLETDVNAECQYTTFINTPYGGSAMQTFSSTGTTKHAVTLTGLSGTMTAAKTYTYFARCKDAATGDVNTSDYSISFTISGAMVVSGPDPYTCLINENFVENNIPYLFDVCIPK